MPVWRIGFGAALLLGKSTWTTPKDPEGRVRALWRAAELGANLFDTADAYGPHVNEEQIAEALFPYAKCTVVATKCGLGAQLAAPRMILRGAARGHPAFAIWQRGTAPTGSNHLYQLHRIDLDVPLEEAIGAMAELQAEGSGARYRAIRGVDQGTSTRRGGGPRLQRS